MRLAFGRCYPVTLADLQLAARQNNTERLNELKAIRAERFELMSQLSLLPEDMVFSLRSQWRRPTIPSSWTQWGAARIKRGIGRRGISDPEGLKDIYKDFNSAGEDPVERLKTFRRHGVYVLGSFIFGLPSDRAETFDITASLAQPAEIAFAQFVMLTPFPGTVNFNRWEKMMEGHPQIAGVPVTRRWLIPQALRPKLYWPHLVMSAEEIRGRTEAMWDKFYSLKRIWKRSDFIKSTRGRLAFVLISRIDRQMYADTGIATDSAGGAWSARWVRWLARPCQRLFAARPMPHLSMPVKNR